MIVGHEPIATQGFGSFWLWSDKEDKYKPRSRDYRLSARSEECLHPGCNAKPGEPCTRPSIMGGRLPRMYPHTGRAKPMHSVVALAGSFNDSRPPRVRIYGDR